MPNMRVEQVAGEIRQSKNGPYFGIKLNGQWYNCLGDARARDEIAGKLISCTIRPSANPKYPSWVKIDAIAPPEPVHEPAPEANGADHEKPDWIAFSRYVEEFHKLATALEPDVTDQSIIVVDRSRTRAAILNTLIIAYGQGRFTFPGQADDGENPFA